MPIALVLSRFPPPARRSGPGESVQAFYPVRGWSLSDKRTKTVGEEAGAKAGQIDIGCTGDKLSGSIAGSAGTVQVTGSVKSGASGFDIMSKLDFQDFKGASGIAITGTVESTYKLTVDVIDPMSPKITFSSAVKGHLVTGDGKVVDIDMTVDADQGKLTCGGTANGVPLDSDCEAGSAPCLSPAASTPMAGASAPTSAARPRILAA